jgi:hypothetical protein
VVEVPANTETREAPRGQAGVPTTRFVRRGVEGATTENIVPIFEGGATPPTGRGPRRAECARWGGGDASRVECRRYFHHGLFRAQDLL